MAQELPQKLCIERRLEGFPDEVDLKALSLHGQCSPTIALLGVGVDVVNEVPSGMESEEASSRSPIAGGFCWNIMTFPASTIELLKSGVLGFLLEMCLLEEHDRVFLTPNPVLDLFAKEGDIAEGDVQCLLTGFGFLWKVFGYIHGRVGD